MSAEDARVFRITTDHDTGASYIYLFAVARVARTVERQALIDLDDNGNVVGVELPSVILPPAGDPHVGSPQAVETRAGEGRTAATSPAGGHECSTTARVSATTNPRSSRRSTTTKERTDGTLTL